MIAQETLFDIALPPEPPKPVIVADPLGECCKCGKAATRQSPSGSIYCAECGKCGHWYMDRQTLCGISVEEFVMHPRLGIWVCTCALKFESEVE